MFSLWLILVRKMNKSPHKERRVAIPKQMNGVLAQSVHLTHVRFSLCWTFCCARASLVGEHLLHVVRSPSRLYRSAKQIKALSQITFPRLLHNSRTRTGEATTVNQLWSQAETWRIFTCTCWFISFLANATHSNYPYKCLMLFVIKNKQLFLYIFYRRTLQNIYFFIQDEQKVPL